MKKERLEVLLCNFITYINYELLEHMGLEEKIQLLKEEIGFEDEEIKELKLIEKCLEERS